MVQPVSERDADAALACAEAFLRVAEPLVVGIRERVEESTQPQPFQAGIGDVVAGATNLAFAIELYIKVILFVTNIKVPQGRDGHDLGKLYAALPQHFRIVIEKRYEEMRRRDWDGKYPSLTLAKRPQPASLPKWDDDSESLDLGPLLTRSADVFTSWRYIWEFRNPGQDQYEFHRLEYGLLVSACRAVRDTINWLQSSPANREM